ncbi:SIR2 family protein [Pseudomonas sp. zfem001]|uniref:SIR2 family protein n=1 Tax=Pseudomonas sp. zfem001 TaxID=3078196 RepID=UPI0029298A5E|nr:SIR2 family protein [Pseudomonas sp. zfem001]MDU9406351.1 SIR2 family protein [Pseudomonas sp. zfem001]
MSRSTHNPDQYMFGFRQIASNGRKKIGILIGAGAPVGINIAKEGQNWESLIPNLDGLTRIVKGKLTSEDLAVYNILEATTENPNLEKILSKIRALSEVIGNSEIHGYSSTEFNSLSENICNLIRDAVSKELPLKPTPYSELVSWINGVNRKHGIEIFTTNYDLLAEQALERSKTPYFDGFSGSHNAFFDPSSISRNDLPPRWVRLWKLHGSIGWEKNDKNEIVRIPKSPKANMVYPSHIKYDQTQAAPFSSLFERLKNFLLEPDTILISTGFSFADAHISSKLLESLQANPSSALLAFQYQKLDNEPFITELALKCPGISAYCRDGAVINGVKAEWKLGSLPSKGWEHIRKEYYNNNEFLLGDFSALSRFLATAGGDFSGSSVVPPQELTTNEDNKDDGNPAMEQ